MGRRHRAREIALKLLYQIDMTGEAPGEALAAYLGPRRLPKDVAGFAEELVRGVWDNREKLDQLVGDSADHWKVERMPAVDRNLLRLATYELVHSTEAPPAVVIDEALELAKRYCDADSTAFVNGVLDQVRRQLAATPPGSGSDGDR